MPEAVIVATARSPIGRAFKGSLKDVRPDDITAFIVKALLEKVPDLPPGEIEDLILGCGQPAGEAGFNIARVVAVLAGLDHVQPLLLLVAADDPDGGARHQGR
jgi:acetyl-CoA C-acetyltransferase